MTETETEIDEDEDDDTILTIHLCFIGSYKTVTTEMVRQTEEDSKLKNSYSISGENG